MERVKKGERYWFINSLNHVVTAEENGVIDSVIRFETGNYFNTKEEAEIMAEKLRAVLKGADVIEMPSEEEISRESDYSAHKMDIDDGETPNSGLYWHGWGDAIRWIKSKIVK